MKTSTKFSKIDEIYTPNFKNCYISYYLNECLRKIIKQKAYIVNN